MENSKDALRFQLISSEAEFARSEFREIDREQARLRIVAPSIAAGFIVSIVLPLLLLGNTAGRREVEVIGIPREDIIGLSLLGRSLVYAVLGVIHITLSGRRSVLARYLRDEVPKYLRSIDVSVFCQNSPLYALNKRKREQLGVNEGTIKKAFRLTEHQIYSGV